MDVQYTLSLSGSAGEGEVARLVAEVRRAARQTGRVSQAVTRVAAEVQCLADVVGALVAQCGEGFPLGSAPVPRSAPDGEPSR
jgi:hypothetical protein